jgi:peptidoglycan L-alanyl-D-glutamate endopeptidase CwlK
MLNEQNEFLNDLVKLMKYMWDDGCIISGGELWRSPDTQALYLQQGKSKTMKSSHLDRLAIDFNVFKNSVLLDYAGMKPYGEYWESLNEKNRWGGSWRGLIIEGKSTFVDSPHFERKVKI